MRAIDDEDEFEGEPPAWRERLRAWLMRHPKDAVALLAALGATGAIVANALLLQSGPHPAPMFSLRPAPPIVAPAVVPPLPRPAAVAVATVEPPTSPLRSDSQPLPPPLPPPRPRPDAIADLISTAPVGSSPRVLAVQRALTEFGYGQIKPTGIAGPDTAAAIERFQRTRKLPVTGRISEQLIRELAAVTGRAIE